MVIKQKSVLKTVLVISALENGDWKQESFINKVTYLSSRQNGALTCCCNRSCSKRVVGDVGSWKISLYKQIARVRNRQTTHVELSNVATNQKYPFKRGSIHFSISSSMLWVDGEIYANDSLESSIEPTHQPSMKDHQNLDLCLKHLRFLNE